MKNLWRVVITAIITQPLTETSDIKRFGMNFLSEDLKKVHAAAKKSKGGWSLRQTVAALQEVSKNKDRVLVLAHSDATPFLRFMLSRNGFAVGSLQTAISDIADCIMASSMMSSDSACLSFDHSGAWMGFSVKRSEWVSNDPDLWIHITRLQEVFKQNLRDIAHAFLPAGVVNDFFALHTKSIGIVSVVDLDRSLNILAALIDSKDIYDRKYQRFTVEQYRIDILWIMSFHMVYAKVSANQFLYQSIPEYLFELQFDKQENALNGIVKFFNILIGYGVLKGTERKYVEALLECMADSRTTEEPQYQAENFEVAWANLIKNALLLEKSPMCEGIMSDRMFFDFFKKQTLSCLWEVVRNS